MDTSDWRYADPEDGPARASDRAAGPWSPPRELSATPAPPEWDVWGPPPPPPTPVPAPPAMPPLPAGPPLMSTAPLTAVPTSPAPGGPAAEPDWDAIAASPAWHAPSSAWPTTSPALPSDWGTVPEDGPDPWGSTPAPAWDEPGYDTAYPSTVPYAAEPHSTGSYPVEPYPSDPYGAEAYPGYPPDPYAPADPYASVNPYASFAPQVPYGLDTYPPEQPTDTTRPQLPAPYSPATPSSGELTTRAWDSSDVAWDAPAPGREASGSWDPPVPTLAPSPISVPPSPAPVPATTTSGGAPRVSWDTTTTTRAVLARPFVVAQSDDPAIGPLLGFTVAWIAGSTALYLLWSLIFGEDRGAIMSQFTGSLPWILTAAGLALACALLLRWGVAGWRAGLLSFAAAVIGGGIATLAYSLAF